jgi:hypothetical protein
MLASRALAHGRGSDTEEVIIIVPAQGASILARPYLLLKAWV